MTRAWVHELAGDKTVRIAAAMTSYIRGSGVAEQHRGHDFAHAHAAVDHHFFTAHRKLLTEMDLALESQGLGRTPKCQPSRPLPQAFRAVIPVRLSDAIVEEIVTEGRAVEEQARRHGIPQAWIDTTLNATAYVAKHREPPPLANPSFVATQLTAAVRDAESFREIANLLPQSDPAALPQLVQIAHQDLHNGFGGAMALAVAPAALVFWCVHAWIDDLYQVYLDRHR